MNKSIFELRIPEDYSLEKFGISQSLLSTFQTCKRKFLFTLNRYYLPESERKYAYGTFAHLLLELVYKAFFIKNIKYSNLLDFMLNEIEIYKFPSLLSIDEQEIMKAKAQALFEVYIEFYKKDFTELRFEAIEEMFDKVILKCLTFDGVRIRGKRDGRVIDKNRIQWNFEHKNYSKISEDFGELLTFDLQNLFYLFADRLEGRIKIAGTKYNIIRNPEVRKVKNANGIYKHLSDIIRKDPKHYFIRYEVPYSQESITDFSKELFCKITDIRRVLKVRNDSDQLFTFYKNEKACTSPYRCDFLQACSSCSLAGYKQKPRLFMELESEKKAIKINKR